jgi:hypothetical protein
MQRKNHHRRPADNHRPAGEGLTANGSEKNSVSVIYAFQLDARTSDHPATNKDATKIRLFSYIVKNILFVQGVAGIDG